MGRRTSEGKERGEDKWEGMRREMEGIVYMRFEQGKVRVEMKTVREERKEEKRKRRGREEGSSGRHTRTHNYRQRLQNTHHTTTCNVVFLFTFLNPPSSCL